VKNFIPTQAKVGQTFTLVLPTRERIVGADVRRRGDWRPSRKGQHHEELGPLEFTLQRAPFSVGDPAMAYARQLGHSGISRAHDAERRNCSRLALSRRLVGRSRARPLRFRSQHPEGHFRMRTKGWLKYAIGRADHLMRLESPNPISAATPSGVGRPGTTSAFPNRRGDHPVGMGRVIGRRCAASATGRTLPLAAE
jgi:hypothetical protein